MNSRFPVGEGRFLSTPLLASLLAACGGEAPKPKVAGPAGEGLACSQAGLPASAASREFLDAFNARYGPNQIVPVAVFRDNAPAPLGR